MAMNWDESLRLGHEAIDAQHMEIFAQIDRLSEKITEGADDIEIRSVLNYLGIYAKKHFFDEEKLMAEYSYFGLHKQQKEHLQFKHEIDEIARMLRKHGSAIEVALRIETTLIQYFIHHVGELDKELAEFIQFQDRETQKNI